MRVVVGGLAIFGAIALLDVLGVGPVIVERLSPTLQWEGAEFPIALAQRVAARSRTGAALESQQESAREEARPDDTAALDAAARPFSRGLGMTPSLLSGSGLPLNPGELGCKIDTIQPSKRMTKAEYNAHQQYNDEGLDLAVGTGRLTEGEAYCKRTDGGHVFLASWTNYALIIHPTGRQEAKRYAAR